MSGRLIREHEQVWREFHRDLGITLAESKRDWLDLLAGDSAMTDPSSWGDLAGTTTETERRVFRAWLREGNPDV